MQIEMHSYSATHLEVFETFGVEHLLIILCRGLG